MTKFVLCVKIETMKAQILRKTKTILITILSVLLALCTFLFAKAFNVAKADQIISNNFLPQTELEYTELISPIDVYYDQTVCAIADETQKLFIHYNGAWLSPLTDFQAIKQVKKLNDKDLLVSNSGSIYKVDLTQLTDSPQTAKTPLTDGSNNIGGNFFDINDNYLVATYSTVCLVYSQTENGFAFFDTFTVKDSTPVAINQNNQIFFVDSNGIAIYDTLTKKYLSLCKGVFPSKMIANDNFIYYIAGNDIFMLSTAGGDPIKLSISDIDADFDLGVLTTPVAISFKGENLLITDQNTIQEYKIENQTLTFTGFAIAKNKTAFNRVSQNATEIEKTNKNVAVLDNYKLTVYTNNNIVNRYSRENYKNYLIEDLILDQISPSSFALGEQNALLLYNPATPEKFVALLDFTKQNYYLSNRLSLAVDSVIRDVCYQSGYYYLLCDNGNAPQHIYKASASAESLDFVKIDSNVSTNEFTSFNVDTYGNVYLANKTTVAKLNKADNYTELTTISTSFNNVSKLQSDLLGRLFVLDSGKIKRVENNTIIDYSETEIKSFAFDFVDDNVYYLTNNSEMILSSIGFENLSINDLKVSENFNLTNPQNQISANENLEFYTVKAGENAFVVESSQAFITNDKFVYKYLSSYTDEYVLICAIECLNEQRFYALANQDSFVLVDKNLVEKVDKQKDLAVNQTAFITTNVNAYYLPIITANDTFALNDGIEKITLNKTTEIKPQFKVSFLGCDYYYAEFTDNGISKFAYIPCDFTIDVLTEDFTFDEFTTERVNKTWVYSDSDMQTKIFSLKENTLIKIIEKGNKVCKIAYKDGNEYKVGYIYTSKIIDKPSIAVRNVIIILAVFTCVFSTSLYFILRKKRS